VVLRRRGAHEPQVLAGSQPGTRAEDQRNHRGNNPHRPTIVEPETTGRNFAPGYRRRPEATARLQPGRLPARVPRTGSQ
jgi:hypothetical protein